MAEPTTSAPSDPKDPASFLSSIIGIPVTVKLNSGVVYKGELQSVDGYMNIALEKCEEHVEGKLRRKYGDAFVRGNNGTSRAICVYFGAVRRVAWERRRRCVWANEHFANEVPI